MLQAITAVCREESDKLMTSIGALSRGPGRAELVDRNRQTAVAGSEFSEDGRLTPVYVNVLPF